jgi:hypothetical protein
MVERTLGISAASVCPASTAPPAAVTGSTATSAVSRPVGKERFRTNIPQIITKPNPTAKSSRKKGRGLLLWMPQAVEGVDMVLIAFIDLFRAQLAPSQAAP